MISCHSLNAPILYEKVFWHCYCHFPVFLFFFVFISFSWLLCSGMPLKFGLQDKTMKAISEKVFIKTIYFLLEVETYFSTAHVSVITKNLCEQHTVGRLSESFPLLNTLMVTHP